MKEISTIFDTTKTNIPQRRDVEAIIGAALNAADPYTAVVSNIQLCENRVQIDGQEFSLTPRSRLIVIGLGKAAPAMLNGAISLLGDLVSAGLCVSKVEVSPEKMVSGIHYLKGNHPVPGEGSQEAGKAIQEILRGLNPEDLVLLLLSGGGSALATLPVNGVTLGDMQQLTDTLLRSGATISEMNSVRKHLDLIKGGGLLRMAAPARVVALVLSDVVGSPLDVIASGPAYPDPSTFSNALEVIGRAENYGLIPVSIREHLENGARGQIAETVKPGDELAESASHTIIGSNKESCQAAARKAEELNFYAEVVTCDLVGEAREVGRRLALDARRSSELPRPYVLVYGGETTVTITGKGKGGRNQEVALAAVREMAELAGNLLITLATDGEDGPTDAAGAVVDDNSLKRAYTLGLDPDRYLANNDAYTFFRQMGDLLVTGSTGTNVNDISFIFGF